jgi:Fe/S biogenesis protein NfuA
MDPVLNVTDAAVEKVDLVRGREPDAELLGLWVEVTGLDSQGRFTYDLWLAPHADAGSDDVVQEHGSVRVVIPAASVEALRGGTLDRQGDLASGGLVMHDPPPASPTLGAPPADLSGDAAQRVVRVLDEQINPAIAAHGGVAELVAVEESTAYLRLGGGCVGCGMAAVTLGQGIEVAILSAVPEITRVVDVTDHASGTNPYFEAAKK